MNQSYNTNHKKKFVSTLITSFFACSTRGKASDNRSCERRQGRKTVERKHNWMLVD